MIPHIPDDFRRLPGLKYDDLSGKNNDFLTPKIDLLKIDQDPWVPWPVGPRPGPWVPGLGPGPQALGSRAPKLKRNIFPEKDIIII